jgi:hypothetical protein
LRSSDCRFKPDQTVYFYEVDFPENEDPTYKLIWSGCPIINLKQNTLNDTPVVVNGQPQPINLLPLPTNEDGKQLQKYMQEQAKHTAELASKERIEFEKTRKDLLNQITALQNERVELNIEINNLKADKKVFEALMQEKEERIKDLTDRLENGGDDDVEEPQANGLADKTTRVMSAVDSLVGEGTVAGLINGISTGAGEGISKLVGFLVDIGRKKMGLQPDSDLPILDIPPQPPGIDPAEITTAAGLRASAGSATAATAANGN